MSDRFDFIVIGSGPAGEKAAALAAYFGKHVAIVERSATPGGVVVSNAGIPTKTLRETALYITGFRRRDVYGVRVELDPEATVERLRSRTGEVIRAMTDEVRRNLQRHGIELIHGNARFGSQHSVIVRSQDGSDRTLDAEVILIATGSRPFHPPGIPFGDPDVYDSEDIMKVDRPLYRTVVVGGGAVGCEYASIFTALGVEVTLVDRASRLLPFVDAELSELLAECLTRMGVRVLLDAGRASIQRDPKGLKVELSRGETLRPEQVLFAAGRVGNTDGLGLEAMGVELDARKRIVVDSSFQTTIGGIYAAGDVIGPPALASVSMEQGRVAACHAFGTPFMETLDPLPPFGIYSIPEVAMAGLTEEAAAAQDIDYEVGRGWFERNPRSILAGATEGLIKLVFRRITRELLGVHILGDIASELIHQGQSVIHQGGTIDNFIHSTYNVPTQSEAYKYAAYDGLQRAAERSES
jgi:NAD(P) transhydrogenase